MVSLPAPLTTPLRVNVVPLAILKFVLLLSSIDRCGNDIVTGGIRDLGGAGEIIEEEGATVPAESVGTAR